MISGESMYDETWEVIRCLNQIEAEIALDLLKQADIPAYKLNGIPGMYRKGGRDARIYVRACDRDPAERVLRVLDGQSDIPEEELAAEAEAAGAADPEE